MLSTQLAYYLLVWRALLLHLNEDFLLLSYICSCHNGCSTIFIYVIQYPLKRFALTPTPTYKKNVHSHCSVSNSSADNSSYSYFQKHLKRVNLFLSEIQLNPIRIKMQFYIINLCKSNFVRQTMWRAKKMNGKRIVVENIWLNTEPIWMSSNLDYFVKSLLFAINKISKKESLFRSSQSQHKLFTQTNTNSNMSCRFP